MTATAKTPAPRKKAVPKKAAPKAQLITIPTDRPVSPMEQVSIMKQMGIEVSEMRDLMELQKEHNSMMALQAYNDAVAAFKAENIVITKDKHVSYTTDKGTTEYNHSSLANIVQTIIPFMSKYGLSHNWLTEQGDGLVKVTCVLTHRDGHSERTTLMSNPDNSGGKNSIQAIASAVKYLERYTLTALLGLAEKDEFENDGRGFEEYITPDQETVLSDLIKETNADQKKFLEYMRAATLGDISAKDFPKAQRALEAKKRTS
jgi:hypothetical protein